MLVLSGFLPIRTDRLVLRRFVAADAATLSGYRSDPDVARYQGWPTPYSVAAARRLIEEQAHLDGPRAGDWLQIAATLAGELIGDVAVRLSDDGRTARIGYTIAPAHQRRGFGVEAVGTVVSRLFEAAGGLHRVQASLDARNIASARLLAAARLPSRRHRDLGRARRRRVVRRRPLRDPARRVRVAGQPASWSGDAIGCSHVTSSSGLLTVPASCNSNVTVPPGGMSTSRE